MKRNMRRKLLCIVTAALLAVTMMPATAFGFSENATDMETATDGEDRDYYTKIVLAPHTFYDIGGGARQQFDDKMIMKTVKEYLLYDWVDIANGCLRTGAKAATLDSSRYEKAFNNPNASYNCFGDIRPYLRDAETAKNKGSKSRDTLWKTGLGMTDSLANVRQIMGDQIVKQIDHRPLYVRDVLKQGPKDEKTMESNALPEMKNNTKKQNVVYSIVTSINEKTKYGNRYVYNSFGIAFYDFQIRPIQAKNLKYKSATDKYDSMEEAVEKGAPGVEVDLKSSEVKGVALENDSSTQHATQSLTFADKHTIGVTNNTSKTSSTSFGQSINIGMEWGNKLSKAFGFSKLTVSGGATFNEAYSTTTTESKVISDEYTISNTQSVVAPPQTLVTETTTKTKTVIKEEYDTPVAISYKVAVFSLTGDVYADDAAVCYFATRGYDHGFYYCEFGADTNENGISAPENLYNRAKVNPTIGKNDTASGAVVHKWFRRNGGSSYNTTNDGVNWTSGFMNDDPTTKDAVKEAATHIPMLSGGCEYTFDADTSKNVIGELVPLYLPKRFELSKGEGSYSLQEGKTLNLSTYLGVSCLNKNGVPYCRFSQNDGHWVVCDPSGNPIDSTGLSIETDGVGDYILTANQAGKGYVTWKIKDNVTYRAQEEGSVTVASNLSAPIIEIDVKADTFDGYIDVSGDFTGCVGDRNVNLNDCLEATTYDKTGKEVNVPVIWEAKELPEKGIQVLENGDVIMTKAGVFNVRAVVRNQGAENVYSDWFPITVREERVLSNVVFDESVKNDDVLLTNTAESTSHVYDLASFVRGFDQYGDPWQGSLDEVSYGFDSDNEDNAYLEDGKLYITGEGNIDIDLMLNGESCGDTDIGNSSFSLKAEDNIRHDDETIELSYGQSRKIDVRDRNGESHKDGLAFVSDNLKAVKVSADGTAKAVGLGHARITVTDKYGGKEVIMINVNKAGNPLAIKGKTAVVKGATKGKNGKLKKTKKIAVSKVIAFTKKGQGKMTYTKASGNKKIKINKTTGKVIVKKGLKKGTYKVKVKVKAAGNTNYKASAVKTVTFKIKVK